MIAGRLVRLNTASHASISSAGQSGSGGVTWYQLGASASSGAAHAIIASAHLRDSGAGPTRHSPSGPRREPVGAGEREDLVGERAGLGEDAVDVRVVAHAGRP